MNHSSTEAVRVTAIEDMGFGRNRSMSRTKSICVLMRCAQCPYCDGENILGTFGQSDNESNAGQDGKRPVVTVSTSP
jgi:hypothetical protein